MTRPVQRSEPLPLRDCRAGDEVHVPFNVGQGAYGILTIVKIKRISARIVQIKYRRTFGGTTVIKADLPADLVVQKRTPLPKAEDVRSVPTATARPDPETTASPGGFPAGILPLSGLYFEPGQTSPDGHRELEHILRTQDLFASEILHAAFARGRTR